MAGTKLNIGAQAAPAVIVGLLLATCLLLAATTADASRPLKLSASASPSSSEGDGAQQTVESPPLGSYIVQTVVVGTTEQQDGGAAGHSRSMNVDMLGGIKNQGPSPGDGH